MNLMEQLLAMDEDDCEIVDGEFKEVEGTGNQPVDGWMGGNVTETLPTQDTKNSNRIITPENKDTFNSDTQSELDEILTIAETKDQWRTMAEPGSEARSLLTDSEEEASEIIDKATDQQVLSELENAEYPTPSYEQIAKGETDTVIRKARFNLPKVKVASGNSPEAVARRVWAEICNRKADLRFRAAVQICASKVGTARESAQYLTERFPILRTMGLTEEVFMAMINMFPEVGEAWGQGCMGDELSLQVMKNIIVDRAEEEYTSGKLTAANVHKYSQSLGNVIDVELRQKAIELKAKELGLKEREVAQIGTNDNQTSITFNLTRRDSNGESDSQSE